MVGMVSRLCEEVHRGDSDYPSKEAKGGEAGRCRGLGVNR